MGKIKAINIVTVWVVISTLFLMMMVTPGNRIYAASEGGYEYEGNGDGTATITGYTGKLKDIVIPDVIDGLTVTGIGDRAFEGNILTKVTIPDSVTKIGYASFIANNLKSVTISENATEIEDSAFFNNQLTSVKIPGNVERIGDEAFFGNRLESVKISDGVDSIGIDSFRNNQLTEVAIPDSVTSIEANSFQSNELTDVKLGNGLVSIGSMAFAFNQLASVTIPDSVTCIGEQAFLMNEIANLKIGRGLKNIKSGVFSYNSLTTIILPENIANIEEYAFENNQPLRKIEIKNKDISIDLKAFDGMNYTKIKIISYHPSNARDFANSYGYKFGNILNPDYDWEDNGDGTATIIDYVGEDTDVIIPEKVGELTVTGIEKEAFANYGLQQKITSVIIPDSVTSIGDVAFYNNELKHLELGSRVTNIGYRAFHSNQLASIKIRNRDTVIGELAFLDNQYNPTDLTIMGYESSTAKDYAVENDHTFIIVNEGVTFSSNGNSEWKKTHSTSVDVSGLDETEPLQYAWAKSTGTPTEPDRWTDFSDGATLETPKESGEYYLHVKGKNLFGEIFNHRSKVFKVDLTKPTLTITPSTTESTHDDVVLTVKGSDNHSEVKRIKEQDGNWQYQGEISYNAKKNGIYEFVVEDDAGNLATESITITNIDKTISFEIPTLSKMDDITLSNQPTTHTVDIPPINVKDWRNGSNNWRLDVSTNRLKIVDGDYKLPTGTINLKSLSDIERIAGKGNVPDITITTVEMIDNGKVTIAKGNGSRGEYNLTFPREALEILIDPTTAKVNNHSGTKYETTIKWDLITAP